MMLKMVMYLKIIKGTQEEVFNYNSAGAITARTKDGITTYYSYDGAGRLNQVKVGVNIIAQYEYDAYGRLIKTIEGNITTIRLPRGNETAYVKVIEQGRYYRIILLWCKILRSNHYHGSSQGWA